MKLLGLLVVLLLVAVALSAPAEEVDAPADLAADDLTGSEFFFRPRYYRGGRGRGYGRRYGGYGGYGGGYGGGYYGGGYRGGYGRRYRGGYW